jgi:glycosyltransferase involved in cell wall biosynthesis
MADVPFFSICIPNYNYASYVRETVESVLVQTFTDFEIVIVDNASTDNSWEIINELCASDSRIRAFRNNYNVGFAPNLQRATEKAKGKYINLLSSDDIMYPDALQVYYETIQNNPEKKVILHSAYNLIDSKSKVFRSCFRRKNRLDSYFTENATSEEIDAFRVDEYDGLDVLKYALLRNSSVGAFCTIVYSREIWNDVEGYDMTYLISPDKGFLIKALAATKKYLYVNKKLFGYRVHNNNQIAKSGKQAVLKLQLDGYVRCFTHPEALLNLLQISRGQLEQRYIDFICLDFARAAIKENQIRKSVRIFFFALATYPKHVFLNPKCYQLIVAYLLSPVLKPLLLLFNRKS